MNTHLRMAGLKSTPCADLAHASVLTSTLCAVVLATAGCGDMAPSAASGNEPPQPSVSALGQSLHTEQTNLSHGEAAPPAVALAPGTDEFFVNQGPVPGGDQTRVVFLHGLHSPFGMALAMSRIPTPR